jgi:membrane protease YdiL (CAAX protease family)
VAAAAAGAFAVAAVVPSLRPLLDDARIRRLELGGVAYHALVRIPFGTVVLEELAFRAALLGALVRVSGPARAAVVSSAVFGLWHVRPTLGLLSANDIAPDALSRAGAVAGAVVFTTAGGVLFSVLRLRSGSVVAPMIAHVATNAFGVVASAVTR